MKPNLSRLGSSLIECSVAITMSAVLFALAASSLAAVMRHQREENRQRTLQITWSRLADQFRDDVHQAQAVETSPAGEAPFRLTLSFPDEAPAQQADYELQGARLTRTITLASQAGQPPATRREVFTLPDDCKLRVEESEVAPDAGRIVTLVVDYPLAFDRRGKRRELPLAAQVGRDWRWMRPSPEDAP